MIDHIFFPSKSSYFLLIMTRIILNILLKFYCPNSDECTALIFIQSDIPMIILLQNMCSQYLECYMTCVTALSDESLVINLLDHAYWIFIDQQLAIKHFNVLLVSKNNASVIQSNQQCMAIKK